METIKETIHAARSLRADYRIANHVKCEFYYKSESTEVCTALAEQVILVYFMYLYNSIIIMLYNILVYIHIGRRLQYPCQGQLPPPPVDRHRGPSRVLYQGVVHCQRYPTTQPDWYCRHRAGAGQAGQGDREAGAAD